MGVYQTLLQILLEIRGIPSPKHYCSSDQHLPFQTDHTYTMGTQPMTGIANMMYFLRCSLTYNTVRLFNFVQIMSLIFTSLNNFRCTFSIAMEKDVAQITSELNQTSLLRVMHIGAHRMLPRSWTSGILQRDSKVLQRKNSAGWRDALR